jgi:NhaP-type Na+/H+ or K+/H+ antiporter
MQTRLGSLTESVLNVASGFVLAFVVWQFIAAPLFGYEVTLLDNLGLTSIFTVFSVARSYLWRRFFNWRYVRKAGGKNV